MATCDASTVLASGANFERLDDASLQIVIAQLLYQIAGSAATANELMAQGMANFGALSPEQIQLVQTQLLCEISSA